MNMNTLSMIFARMLNILAEAPAIDANQIRYESANRYSVLIFSIIAIGIAGVVVIVLFSVLWHRNRKRSIKLDTAIQERREGSTPLACAWESSADRISSQETNEILGIEPNEGEDIDDTEEDVPDWNESDWNPSDEDDEKGDIEGEDDGPRYW